MHAYLTRGGSPKRPAPLKPIRRKEPIKPPFKKEPAKIVPPRRPPKRGSE